MAVISEISRVDFVRLPDGSMTFCVGVKETAPDPFNEGQTIVRMAQPDPMTPEMVLQRYGWTLADIVAGLNADMAVENAALKAQVRQGEAALGQAQAQLAELQATS